MKTGARNVTGGLLAAVVLVLLSGCFQPTVSPGTDPADGDEPEAPTVPPVDDYTTLFKIAEDGVLVLPGTDGTDDAAIGDGSVSIGDLDNDGDLDVVLAGTDFSGTRFTAVYLNDGTGVFTDAGATLPAVGTDSATALGDVNGDGTLDLFVTGDESVTTESARLYTNQIVNGKPSFTEDTSSSFAALTQGRARFFDADNDDDLDLLVTGLENRSDHFAYLYINQGPTNPGVFELSDNGGTPSLSDRVQRGSVGIADFDGQNGLDIVFTGLYYSGRGTTLVLNDGSGVFTVSASAQPFIGLSSWSSTSVADVDGNGSSDLFITGYYASNDFRARLYSNNGTGLFTDVTATNASEVVGVQESASAFGDIDLDGDVDLIVSGRDQIGSAARIWLYLNDGAGNFSLQDTGSSLYSTLKGTIDLFDVDGDSDLDLLVTGVSGASTPNAILHINTLFN